MSWEKVYTFYLADRTRNSVAQYGKAKLADYYKTEGTLKNSSSDTG